MTWIPLNETYFVKPDEIKVSSLVPDNLRANLVEIMTGTIIAAGTGTLLESGVRAPLQAVTGDKVMFGAKVGHKVKVSGQELLLLAEANILAVERE